MFTIPTIILGLSVIHLCLAAVDPSGQQIQEQAGYGYADDKRRVEARILTVDAAMGTYSENILHLYLFTGNKVQVLKDKQFFEERPRTDFHLPDDMHLQAAFVTHETEDKRIYYGDKYGKFVSARDGIEERRLKYGPARAFIRDGGPDAAGRWGGKVYVFKGCQVAVRNGWNDWEKPVNVSTLGLPCYVDAAWNENDQMVLLRGHQVWFWKADGSVVGGYPFATFYTLKIGDLLAVKTLPPPS